MSDNSGKGEVTYRIDKDPASTIGMAESNDNSALGLWRGRSSIPFVRKLLDGSNLLIRAQPFSDSTVTAEYDIRGIDEAIKPLMEACSWRPESSSLKPSPSRISLEELEEERRLMQALMEQMRTEEPPTSEELRTVVEEERQKLERTRREREARELAERQRQIAELNANSEPQQNSFLNGNQTLASILGAASDAAQSAAAGSGSALSPGETQAVLNQLRRCWRVDTVSANARDLVVTMRAEIRPNGFVNQSTIGLVSPNPAPAEYQIAIDRARSALRDLRCQPFALPPQKYNAWRNIVIRFDPAQLMMQ